MIMNLRLLNNVEVCMHAKRITWKEKLNVGILLNYNRMKHNERIHHVIMVIKHFQNE